MAHISQVPDVGIYADIPSACRTLLSAKAKAGKTYDDLAKITGADEVLLAAIFFGQMKASPDVLKSICSTLDVPLESIAAELGEGFVPMRGTCKMPPTDPTIYRLYEALTVYGHPLKQIIYEKFGDGIMSAIAFRCKVEKIEEESGTRVQITFNGKWLPYAWK